MKKIIRIICLLITIVTVLIILNNVLCFKSEDGIDQMRAFYKQEEGTIDVLFLGSSHTYCNINTGLLWEEYGIAGFDLAGPEQPFWNNYFYMKEALKYQRPKVIVLDVFVPGVYKDDFQGEHWMMYNIYGMKWSRNRIEAQFVSSVDGNFFKRFVPFVSEHNRYHHIDKEDFLYTNQSINYKGFDPREGIEVLSRPEVSAVNERTPISSKSETYYRKIIELAQKEDIPLLVINPPFQVSEESQKIYNYIFDIAEENAISYLDYNKMYDEVGIDFNYDMAEWSHLNRSGNEKFTRHLGKYLADQYAIENKKGNQKYDSWNIDAKMQKQDTARYKLSNTWIFNEYIPQLMNDEYLTIITVRGENDLTKLTEENKLQLNSIGITEELFTNGATFVYDNGNIKAINDEEFEVHIEKNSTDIVISRKYNEFRDEFNTVFIKDQECFVNKNGINIAVYDKYLDRIVDQVGFVINEDMRVIRE